ncbi:MAG: hypothetical protein B7733_03650 [Myxococcales bacterium FL481]|nr:MAG: hypothetical protein B7733_03650 [Myxococcales bacterium FL481]
MINLPRLVRTVRPLRREQWLGQVAMRLRAPVDRPARMLWQIRSDGEQPRVSWRPTADWLHPDGTVLDAADVERGTYRFVGHARELGNPPQWRADAAPKLWRYNLHYHGFLYGLPFASAKALVQSYLAAAGPEHEPAEGWEPYPLSLRLANWVMLFFGRWRDATLADRTFSERLWLEIRRMATWLSSHVEVHLMANHLLENAAALALAGVCFDGERARVWRTQGLALLRAQLDEQILPDGGHYERSPMYHQRVVYLLIALANTGDPELRTLVAPRVGAALTWLAEMTHPDGEIAHFNDAATGIYPAPARLLAWAQAVGLAGPSAAGDRSTWRLLPDSGYLVARSARGHVVIMDVGEIGPAHQPGHAHADFLSLEISWAGRRFVVDGGNFEYESGERRDWARGVEAHSTVFVVGEQPLELWGAFRVGRRGHPIGVDARSLGDGAGWLTAAHTGYQHLPASPVPRRELQWDPLGVVRVLDRVDATAAVPCASQLRIDGEWSLHRDSSTRYVFQRGAERAYVLSSVPIEVGRCRHFPRFGETRPAHLLRCRFRSGERVEWVVCHAGAIERAEAWQGDRTQSPARDPQCASRS